jgi:hypothetical protein
MLLIVDAWEVAVLEIRERPPSMLRNIDGGPLAGADEDLGAPTINANKCRWWAPSEVPKLEIQERPPSTVRNVDGGPPRRCQS